MKTDRRSFVVTFGIVAFVLCFASVPLFFLMFGCGAAALGGIFLLGLLIAIQAPIFLLLRAYLPKENRTEKNGIPTE